MPFLLPPPPLPPSTSTSHTVTPHQLPPPPPPPAMASLDATITRLSPRKQGPPPPPPAPMTPRTIPPPPPPIQQGKGGAPPPPPPVGGTQSLHAKATTKLKRPFDMGSLYLLLKGKVEGSSLDGKSLKRSSIKVGAAASGGSGKQGMADALAEMTKRSSYFIQIEEDVKNYANSIKEVLARFEDFPSKKLAGLRMAAALYPKLDTIATTLQNWKIESPANQLLDKVETYFNKAD